MVQYLQHPAGFIHPMKEHCNVDKAWMVKFGILYETQTKNKLGTSSKGRVNKCAHTQGNASVPTWHAQWGSLLGVSSCYSQHVCPMSWANTPASLHRAVRSLSCTSCTLLFEMQVCSSCGQLSTSCSANFLTPLHKPIQNATNFFWTPKQQIGQVSLEFLHLHHEAVPNPNCGGLTAFEKSKTTPMSFSSFAPLNKTNICSYPPHLRCYTAALQAV